jgi:hypothetical protein
MYNIYRATPRARQDQYKINILIIYIQYNIALHLERRERAARRGAKSANKARTRDIYLYIWT